MNQPSAPTTLKPRDLEPCAFNASLRTMYDGYKTAMLLQSGFDCGIFDWLERNAPAGKSAIAEALQLRGAHLGAYLQALVDLGCLVHAQGDTFSLSPAAQAALRRDSAWCQQPVLAGLTHAHGRWSQLAHFMNEAACGATASPAQLWQQAGGTIEQHPMLEEARQVIDCMLQRFDLGSVRSLVCFDGCDGLAARVIHTFFPALDITVVVPEADLERARLIQQQAGPDARWTLLAGTPLDAPPQGQQFGQLVLCHGLNPVRRTTAKALESVAAWAAPGAGFFAAHWFCQEACASAPGGLQELDKAILTDSHPLCHVEHFCERLTSAGFTDCQASSMRGPFGETRLHLARKTT